MRTAASLVFILVLLASCDRNLVFKEYQSFENLSWNRMDFKFFEVPVKKGESLDFFLFFRHHSDFPYDKLFTNITFYLPDGEMRSAEYDFDLKDKEGNWEADGIGELWDIEFPLIEQVTFDRDGICTVRVENKYPKVETPGVIEIGLLARKSMD